MRQRYRTRRRIEPATMHRIHSVSFLPMVMPAGGTFSAFTPGASALTGVAAEIFRPPEPSVFGVLTKTSFCPSVGYGRRSYSFITLLALLDGVQSRHRDPR